MRQNVKVIKHHIYELRNIQKEPIDVNVLLSDLFSEIGEMMVNEEYEGNIKPIISLAKACNSCDEQLVQLAYNRGIDE